jgi:hypothetical protein
VCGSLATAEVSECDFLKTADDDSAHGRRREEKERKSEKSAEYIINIVFP